MKKLAVKEFYIVYDKDGNLLEATSGKFAWVTYAAAKNAVYHHLRSFIRMSKTAQKTDELLDLGYIAHENVFTPNEAYHFKIDGQIYTEAKFTAVRDVFLKLGQYKISRVVL